MRGDVIKCVGLKVIREKERLVRTGMYDSGVTLKMRTVAMELTVVS